MEERTLERVATATGLTATVAVGVPVLVDVTTGGGAPFAALAPWSVLYLGFLAAFVLGACGEHRRPAWMTEAAAAAQLVTAVGAYLVAPSYGWTVVLLVVAAVSAAYLLAPGATAVLVAGLTATVGLGALLAGVGAGDAAVSTLVYGCFLSFAALVVHGQKRATAARLELATTHAQLRASSALLADSRATAERLRIARELHDLIGHHLTALSLELEVAAHHTDGAGHDHVVRARDVAKGLLGDVREAVGELRGPTAGLSEPLAALVDGLPGLEVGLRVVEDVPVDGERALAVVRCVQEIVTNTVRHAGARHLWIEVTAADGDITIDARDDGRGNSGFVAGNGLTGMRERLEQLGGDLRVGSARGGGFEVAARVPTA